MNNPAEHLGPCVVSTHPGDSTAWRRGHVGCGAGHDQQLPSRCENLLNCYTHTAYGCNFTCRRHYRSKEVDADQSESTPGDRVKFGRPTPLRGLLPEGTLVLINGKCQHSSPVVKDELIPQDSGWNGANRLKPDIRRCVS